MLSIFSCAYWPSVCLLWRNVYLDTLSFFCFLFSCLDCFFDIKLYELFVYSGNYSIVGSIICKCFLPFCKLSFHFVYGFLYCTKFLSLIRFRLFIFIFITLGGGSKKKLAVIYVSFLPMLSSKSFIVFCQQLLKLLVHMSFLKYYDCNLCFHTSF